MTRETKIGLLVGLAFIIVIGILLSDYNRIETPTAPLFGDNKNLRQGVGTPTAADNKSQNDRHDTIVYPVIANSPRQQVPTHDDLTTPTGNSDVVVISPFNGDSTNPQRTGNSSQHTIAPGDNEVAINQPRPNIPQGLKEVAKNNGMELVPAGQNEQRPNTGNGATTTNNNTPAPTAGRQYTAESGDTVSKMAGRFMGGNTKANRDAIVAANPTLQKNINNVVVGHVYVIPASAAATVTPTTPAVTQKPQPQTPAAPVNQPAQSPTHWYTVKENDSLWKIAQEQLGDGNAVAAIKELNKDVLKGGDAIRPNMRLRMPAKPVASAS